MTRRFACEAKHRESIGDVYWKWLDGLSRWKGQKIPLLILKRNRRRPLVVLDLEDFCDLIRGRQPVRTTGPGGVPVGQPQCDQCGLNDPETLASITTGHGGFLGLCAKCVHGRPS